MLHRYRLLDNCFHEIWCTKLKVVFNSSFKCDTGGMFSSQGTIGLIVLV